MATRVPPRPLTHRFGPRRAARLMLVAATLALGMAAAANGGLQLAPVDAGPVFLTAPKMRGFKEVPGPGDPDGRGRAEVRVFERRVCWEARASGIGAVTAAHIHQGLRGESGPPVVDFLGDLDKCARVRPGLAAELAAAPEGFYVNIHTAEFPDGAIRDQLRRPRVR